MVNSRELKKELHSRREQTNRSETHLYPGVNFASSSYRQQFGVAAAANLSQYEPSVKRTQRTNVSRLNTQIDKTTILNKSLLT